MLLYVMSLSIDSLFKENNNDIINDEDDIFDEFLESDTLLKLNNLHNASMLTDENLSLKDVSALHQNMPRDNTFNIESNRLYL